MLISGKHSKRWFTAIKVATWIVFAFLLFFAGVLVATVQILTPDKLTPMVEQTANKMLNADVEIGRVELSLRSTFPFLTLDLDTMVVLSRDIRRLPQEARDTLPQWSDTLTTIDRLHGGINVFRLARGVIDLKDVQIHRLQANVLVVNDSINNFNITLPSEEPSDTSAATIPDIRIDRFRLIDPKSIRYADIAQDLYAVATIKSAQLTGNTTSVNPDPQYLIDFDSNVSTPLLDILGQQTMSIGFDGIVEWRHTNPYLLGLKDFSFVVSKFSGKLNTTLDFNDNLTVKAFDFRFDPIVISELMEMVPDSLAHEYYIPKDIETNARIDFSGKISQPYVLGTTDLPFGHLSIVIKPCHLVYEKLSLDEFNLTSEITMNGGSINDAVIDIQGLNLKGAGTSLYVRGTLADMADDPIFDGEIDGNFNLGQLPSVLFKHLRASLDGIVTANTSVIARPSMFSRDGFHNLRIAGDVKVDKFIYIADDTLSMYHINHSDLHFGTHERRRTPKGTLADSLLSATLTVDTADILVSGLDIKVGKLKLGIGAQNSNAWTDTTLIIPMGGALSAGTFSIFAISDTAGLKTRDIKGMLSMRRFHGDAHHPLFLLNLGIGGASAGDNHTRFMLNNASLKCSLGKLPENELTESRRQIRHYADSLHRQHPHLSVDSVYIMALQIRNRNRRPGHHRVHPEITDADNEIIEWGTSHALARLLLDWQIKGELSANVARLFTPSFPVRNRVEGLAIRFNNDTIDLSNVKYKAGNSDFLISGNVTNMRRAFTSKRKKSPLRIKFNILSDHIDVNEITHALMTGSAQSHTKLDDPRSDESRIERDFDKRLSETDTLIAPILIPVNIDAELIVRANTVAYSDFTLKDFQGTVLMYDGAVNLHDLKASSEVGSIDLSAMYSALKPDDIDFGFGLKLSDFNISNFLKLVPAVDSIMPMLHDLSGIVNANLALTTKIDNHMDLIFPSIKAAIHLEGDSISFIDSVTFHKVAKWLMFKNKERNLIDHISAEMVVQDGQMRLYPFIFDFDRYRLGVQGYNDFSMNFNYHIAVLKSPIPFKFGINIKGDYDKLKIRFGGAKFNEKTEIRHPIANDTRINLINQLQNVFRRGVRNSRFATVEISDMPLAEEINLETDTLTAADSVMFRQQGLIPSE